MGETIPWEKVVIIGGNTAIDVAGGFAWEFPLILYRETAGNARH
jgi:hypothetical protein